MKILASLTAFYTLIIPIWEKGPLSARNTPPPNNVTFINSTKLEEQFKFFGQIKDPRIRSQIAISLAQSNNPKAVEKLVLMLGTEKDELVKADILSALLALRKTAKCGHRSLMAKLMTSEAPSIRGKAAVLYLDASGDADVVLRMLGKEKSLFVRSLLWKELRAVPNACNDSELRKLLGSEFDENRAGVTAILAGKSKNPDSDQALQKVIGDPSVIVRMALAKALIDNARGAQLLARLSKDTSTSVRGMVATAHSPPKILNTLVNLASDPDSETRRLAILSLGYFKSATAVGAVIKAFSDKDERVRTAAENAIAAIFPDDETKKKIGGELLDNLKSRHSAVTAIGLLNAKEFAEKVEKLLASTTDEDLSRRCVETLGKLGYTKAWRTVAAKANSKSPGVRRAVATALGVFAKKPSFAVLVKLSEDQTTEVAKEALLWMGRIGDTFFAPALLKAAKRITGSPDIRSYACWGLSKVNSTDPRVTQWLRKIVLTKIIRIRGGQMIFDIDYSRASALLACVDMGKAGNANAAATARDILKVVNNTSDETFSTVEISKYLADLFRQIDAYAKGEKATPRPIPTLEPELTVKNIHEKRR